MKMGLREANQQFSKAIGIVKSGRQVVLTERGKPIAVISPIGADESEDAIVNRLRAEGVLMPAMDPSPMTAWKPVRLRGKTVAQLLREERDER